MHRVAYAFRRNAKGFISGAIRFITRSQNDLSHSEFILPDGRSFSSREPKGASFADIDYSKDEWLLLYFEVTDEQLARIKERCAFYDGKKYDWYGIARFALNIHKRNWFRFAADRPFCSELCCDIAQQHGEAMELDPNLTSPQRLYDALVSGRRFIHREHRIPQPKKG